MKGNDFDPDVEDEWIDRVKKEYQSKFRRGDSLDFYLANYNTILPVVFEYIRYDAKNERLPEADCMAELKRLCEPSVRHYLDCDCPICR